MNQDNPATAETVPPEVLVWDLPTRVFHWFLLASVLVAWITAEEKGWLFAVHRWNGYAMGTAVLFRLVWGVIGSRRSRFADFVAGWRTIRSHAAALVRRNVRPTVGHTPIGGWMILALLTVLALILATGLFSAFKDGSGGPFAHVIGTQTATAVAEIHGTLFNVLLALISVHFAGVLVEMLLTRENLILAMLTGRKRLSAADAAHEKSTVNPLWGLAVAVVAAGVVWLVVA